MISLLAAGVMMAAQTSPATPIQGGTEIHEVAYEQIVSGENAEAIKLLEQARAQQPDDPAILINLGAAYMESGNFERAADCYRDAIESDVRYRVELADGSWSDSRNLARRALRNLEAGALAMK